MIKTAYYLSKAGYWEYTTEWLYKPTEVFCVEQIHSPSPQMNYNFVTINQPVICVLIGSIIDRIYPINIDGCNLFAKENCSEILIPIPKEELPTPQNLYTFNGKNITKAEFDNIIIGNEHLLKYTGMDLCSKCECGAESIGGLAHSNWCPKH